MLHWESITVWATVSVMPVGCIYCEQNSFDVLVILPSPIATWLLHPINIAPKASDST